MLALSTNSSPFSGRPSPGPSDFTKPCLTWVQIFKNASSSGICFHFFNPHIYSIGLKRCLLFFFPGSRIELAASAYKVVLCYRCSPEINSSFDKFFNETGLWRENFTIWPLLACLIPCSCFFCPLTWHHNNLFRHFTFVLSTCLLVLVPYWLAHHCKVPFINS